jgi:cell division protein FtsL
MKTKSEKLFKFIFAFSVVLFVCSFSAKFYFCSNLTTKNTHFDKVSYKKKQLEEEISRLESENSFLSSISRVENRAKELGFIPMESNVISLDISSTEQVALGR